MVSSLRVDLCAEPSAPSQGASVEAKKKVTLQPSDVLQKKYLIRIGIPVNVASTHQPSMMFRLLASVAIGCLGLLFWGACAFGQTAEGDSFRPYPLRYASAGAVGQQLVRAFAGLSQQADVVADARRHQILVRGSAEAHRLAATLIRSFDIPDVAVQRLAAPVEPVLRTYRIMRSQLAEAEAALRRRFGDRPQVRFVGDEKTSQIFVNATPEIQATVSRLLAGSLRPAGSENKSASPKLQPTAPRERSGQANRSNARQPVGDPPGQTFPPRQAEHEPRTTRRTTLFHVTSERFETTLQSLGARPIKDSDAADTDTIVYEIPSTGKGIVGITVDRKTASVSVSGPKSLVMTWGRIIALLDRRSESRESTTRLVALQTARRDDVQKAMGIIRKATNMRPLDEIGLGPIRQRPGDLVAMFFQPKAAEKPPAAGQPKPPDANNTNAQPREAKDGNTSGQSIAKQPPDADSVAGEGGLIGPVRLEYIEELDMIVVTGDPRDVERVLKIISDIDERSRSTRPSIVVHDLQHVGSAAMATLVDPIYDQVLSARQGSVSITALIKPNSLLLIGREENVQNLVALIEQLDRPVDPATELRVFKLRHASAIGLQQTIREFFGDRTTFRDNIRTALGTQVMVVAEYRSNALVIQASPRDMAEVASLIRRLDVRESEAVNRIEIVKLNNSLAEELAPIVQQAISGPAEAVQSAQGGLGGVGGGGAGGQGGARQQRQNQARSIMLQMLTFGADGRRRMTSGILTDVRITADARANALIVSAPDDSMDLVLALIEQLDKLPPSVAQIKVFTIVNADATRLADTLTTLFGDQTGTNGPAVITGSFGDQDSSLIPLRIAVEERTNSVIVSGSSGNLTVVEAILLKLDNDDIDERKTTVIRLKNSPAADVAQAINDFLQGQRDVQQIQPGLLSPFEQIEKEVVVVAEPITNALIISATPRYFDEVTELVEKLDMRPPMVMIQVVIAEVTLSNTHEFGVELGLQDSVLFDRSLAGIPGFLFNNATLGNDVAAVGAGRVAGQGISAFNLGRTNDSLGFGGLVLSASSESVSLLVRALEAVGRVEILSRPHIMTLDNQLAFIQVGAQVPRITGSNVSGATGGTNTTTEDVSVGVILEVTPRISPDGQVVMEIDAINSRVGPIEEGIPVSFAPNGEAILSPQIETITARTTVMASSGQTIVLGGLIRTENRTVNRRVPVLGNLPVVGRLFSYELEEADRRELLFIMTPRVVRNEEEAELIKQVESSRMSWCLADVIELHGYGDPRGLGLADMGLPTIYPDANPGIPEILLPGTSERPAPPPQLGLPQPPPAQPPPAQLPPPVKPQPVKPQRNDQSHQFPDFSAPGAVAPATYNAPTAARPPQSDQPRRLPPVYR